MSLDFPTSALRYARALAVVCALNIASGCTTARAPIAPASNAEAPAELPLAEQVPAVRSGRYTLVELVPERAQRDPMEQIVDITIPPTVTATVGEALRYVLLRTGYRLCEGHEEIRALDALSLPAAHLHLGPLTMRAALEVLIGSARELEVDEAARQVCIRLRWSIHDEITLPMPELPLMDIPSP